MHKEGTKSMYAPRPKQSWVEQHHLGEEESIVSSRRYLPSGDIPSNSQTLTTFPGYSSSYLGSHCWLLGNPQENWNIFHAQYQPADTSWHPVSDWVVSHSLVVHFTTWSLVTCSTSSCIFHTMTSSITFLQWWCHTQFDLDHTAVVSNMGFLLCWWWLRWCIWRWRWHKAGGGDGAYCGPVPW